MGGRRKKKEENSHQIGTSESKETKQESFEDFYEEEEEPVIIKKIRAPSLISLYFIIPSLLVILLSFILDFVWYREVVGTWKVNLEDDKLITNKFSTPISSAFPS
jgi:hypothetical protein